MTILSLSLAVVPTSVRAAPPSTAPVTSTPASEPETPEGGVAAEPAPEGDEGKSPEGGAVEPEPAEPEPEPAVAEPETPPEANPEGGAPKPQAGSPAPVEAGAPKPDPTPAAGALGPTATPLRPMQTAAWWTMFGAFTVGTTAGVLAGLAERQEDRATRLSTLFDAETGAQPLYADRKDEYERYLRRGEGYGKAALGVGVVAGAAAIAAITLFAIDARRQRADAPPRAKSKVARRAKLRFGGAGMEVRF